MCYLLHYMTTSRKFEVFLFKKKEFLSRSINAKALFDYELFKILTQTFAFKKL